MKVLFLQTAHSAHDERVYYHQEPVLRAAGYACAIVSTIGLRGYRKFKTCSEALRRHRPDIVLCDTPYAVLIAKCHGARRVIYDVTEWCSKKILLSLAGRLCDAFIFGEEGKMAPYKRFITKKPFTLLPYFPTEKYIPYLPVEDLGSAPLKLLYAGPATEEKGIGNVLAAVEAIARRLPLRTVELTIITDSSVMPPPKGLHVTWKKSMDYHSFCEELTKYHFFLDLRNTNAQTTQSLPIKLFYYMAAGRPMVYTNMEGIRHFLPEELPFIALVDPTSPEAISDYICHLAQTPHLYREACTVARQYYLSHCRWDDSLSQRLLDVVQVPS